MVNETTQSKIDGIALIGFQLNRNSKTPEIYTFVTFGDTDIPVSSNGEFIFFSSLNESSAVYNLFSKDIKQMFSEPKELSLVLKINSLLGLLKDGEADEESIVLNCLNTFFDFIAHSPFTFPDNYKHILFSFADHLTFDSDIKNFLEESKISRNEIINAVLWCIGLIFVNSKLISK